MAKVVVNIPEPQPEYDVSNQRQILEALDTLKNQLNFSFQQDLKNEDTHVVLKKAGGSDIKISYEELNKEAQNMLKGPLNMEGGDILKLQAGTANKITGQISYLLIDRSQENG